MEVGLRKLYQSLGASEDEVIDMEQIITAKEASLAKAARTLGLEWRGLFSHAHVVQMMIEILRARESS